MLRACRKSLNFSQVVLSTKMKIIFSYSLKCRLNYRILDLPIITFKSRSTCLIDNNLPSRSTIAMTLLDPGFSTTWNYTCVEWPSTWNYTCVAKYRWSKKESPSDIFKWVPKIADQSVVISKIGSICETEQNHWFKIREDWSGAFAQGPC